MSEAIPLLFKILVDGKPCHGGDGQYPPVGEWTKPAGHHVQCCEWGYHLTSDPLRWWKPNATLWLAEPKLPISGDGFDKAAFDAVRLVQEITRDWPYLVMFQRVRCFLAASARSRDAGADISWADLSRANLYGARGNHVVAGWRLVSGAYERCGDE